MLRLDKPGPGVAAFDAFDIGGQSMMVRTAYHFGDRPAETVVRETPPWQVDSRTLPGAVETSQSA